MRFDGDIHTCFDGVRAVDHQSLAEAAARRAPRAVSKLCSRGSHTLCGGKRRTRWERRYAPCECPCHARRTENDDGR